MKEDPPASTSRRSIVRALGSVTLLGLGACLGACATTSSTDTSRELDPAYARKVVDYARSEPPGTIVIDPGSHFLYLVQKGGQAVRYGVGVGGEGFGWSGNAV